MSAFGNTAIHKLPHHSAISPSAVHLPNGKRLTEIGTGAFRSVNGPGQKNNAFTDRKMNRQKKNVRFPFGKWLSEKDKAAYSSVRSLLEIANPAYRSVNAIYLKNAPAFRSESELAEVSNPIYRSVNKVFGKRKIAFRSKISHLFKK